MPSRKATPTPLSWAASFLVLFFLAEPAFVWGKPVDGSQTNFFILPVVYYTPETGVAGSLAGIYYFRLNPRVSSPRPSDLRFTLTYTQKNQMIAQLNYDLNFKNEQYKLDGEFKFSRYPDRFYGIGNHSVEIRGEEFTPMIIRFQLNGHAQVVRRLFAGIHFEISDIQILALTPGGILEQGTIAGSQSSVISGTGPFLNWDTRDNVFAPTSGQFYHVSFVQFAKFLGSDLNFSLLTGDFRNYITLFKTHVLAVQALLQGSSGDVHFMKLPMFGGQYLMRGFYEGRFRHNAMAALQTEYRLPLFWRLGLTGFFSFAQVAEKLKSLQIGEFKESAGLGLRYQFDRSEKLNLRLDIGFGNGKAWFYLSFAEAF